ncbi:MAG: DUF1080 domain-containing protein [Clostridia bacterium]|nr:DUF1080 domain-containing protein [Clostridia bacterium]
MMKKALSLVFSLALALFVAFAFVPTTELSANSEDYHVSNFSALPTDWVQQADSDVANTSASASNGVLSLAHAKNGTQTNANYYGMMYHIAAGQTWSDFTLTMEFSMTDAANDSRWFAIAFRTNEFEGANGNYWNAYLYNYRKTGKSCSSCVEGENHNFRDDAACSLGIDLPPNEFHTLMLKVKGNVARHYMDGQLVHEWDLSSKNNYLGEVMEEGGLAIIANKTTINIRDLRVSRTVEMEKDVSLGGSGEYSISNFTAVPEDSYLEPYCQTTASSVAVTKDGALSVIHDKNTTANNKNYYGNMYHLAKGKTWSDFTMTMVFTMTNQLNDSRWFGLMFRTNFVENGGKEYVNGYIYQFRAGGNTRSSSVSGSGNGFNDQNSLNSGIIVRDGKKHTMMVKVQGNLARYYMDGTLLHEIDLQKKAGIDAYWKQGGIGLVVNQSTINIYSLTVSEDVYMESYGDIDGEFENGMPEDWKLFEGCDTANTDISKDDYNNLLVKNYGGASNALYYGAAIMVEPKKAYSDFTFEMTFRMLDPLNESRWFGVVYHAQQVGENFQGYMMNYRYNGNSAFSAINISRGFSDTATSQGAYMGDMAYHTIKIVLEGSTAYHYMDNKLINTYDLAIRDAHLGSRLTYGGFAIIVNNSTLKINNVKVEGTEVELPQTETDTTLANIYQHPGIQVENAPTVVMDIQNQDQLDSLAGTVRPSNAILHFNEDQNIVDANGEVLDSFVNIYNSCLKGRIVPILKIDTEAQAEAFINMYYRVIDILDMGVMSEDPAIIKMIKEKNSKIRGMIVYNNETDLYNIVATTNKNYATVAVIPQSLATPENVSYIQARFKTVWVMANSSSKMDVYNCAFSGALGIVSDNAQNVYDVLASVPAGSVFRTIFNVAHRGIPSSYNECSVSGTQAAIDMGATHVELDAWLTTDGQIVFCHDSTIDAATNGTGAVESMSSAQLKQYKLDRFGIEDIAFFDDIAPIIKDSNIVLVFEIKSSKEALVDALKVKLDEYDLWDQIVIISFNTNILAKAKATIPEVPTANLNTASIDTFTSVLYWMGLYNTGIDTNRAYASKIFNKNYLCDRGIMGWFWTYGVKGELIQCAQNGYLGVTNDYAGTYGDQIKFVEGVDTDTTYFNPEMEMDVLYTLYVDYEELGYGKIFYWEDKGEYYEAIVVFEYFDQLFYTQSVIIEKAERQLVDCSSSVAGASVLLVSLSIGGVLFARKRKED